MLYPKTNRLKKIGNQLFELKQKGLKQNPVLKLFARLVDSGKILQGSTILFVLINIKSLGMFFFGIIGLTLPVILFQGIMMYALIAEVSERKIDNKPVFQVMILQMVAHISLAIVGNWIGFQYFYNSLVISLQELLDWPSFLMLIMISMAAAIGTARRETLFYQANKRLIN